jgi:hypothetical protein
LMIKTNKKKAHKEYDQNKQKKGNIKEMDTGNVTLANEDGEKKNAHKVKEIVPPVKEPNDIQKHRMLGQTMQIIMLAGMENHVYRFGNEIKKQKEEGPIGLSLTADCYLIQTDNKFLEKLKCAGINLILYEMLKDDITIGEELEDINGKMERLCLMKKRKRRM